MILEKFVGLIHYTFSDSYARKDNWLSSIDVQVKLVYIVSLLTINLIAKNIVIPLSFLFASLSMLLSVKVPFGVILRNMFIPSTFAILILAVKGLHEGEKIWLSFSIAGYDVVLREEGLYSRLIIRAFTRSERTYEAMRARGYEGGVMLAINLPALKKKEYFLVIGMGFLLPMLVYTGDIQVW